MAIYGLHRYGKSLLPPDATQNFLDISNAVKGMNAAGFSKEAVDKLSTSRIDISAGSIVKRISMTKETDIRPGGFYAAFKSADVERYKAVLPIYWKQWGNAGKDGFVVNLKANSDIKAPSPRETFDMFQEFISSSGPQGSLRRKSVRKNLLGLAPILPGQDDDDGTFARQIFPSFSILWNEQGSEIPVVRDFLSSVKERGFNAVVDMNDAGSLGESPMRFLDGSLFNVDSHDVLSAGDIRAAQEAIINLVQSGMLVIDEDVYLKMIKPNFIKETNGPEKDNFAQSVIIVIDQDAYLQIAQPNIIGKKVMNDHR